MKVANAGRRIVLGALAAVAAAGWIAGAVAQNRAFSFAYDQPNTTAYGIAANIFDAKLKELSGGRQSPEIQKPRSEPYFPICIVA